MAQPAERGVLIVPEAPVASQKAVWQTWDDIVRGKGLNAYTVERLKTTFTSLELFRYLSETEVEQLLERWDWANQAGLCDPLALVLEAPASGSVGCSSRAS